MNAMLMHLALAAAAPADAPEVAVEAAPHGAMFSRLAVDRSGDLHLVFRRQREFDLYYTRRGSGEEAFSAPLRVNSIEGSAGSHAVATSPAGRVHVLFTASGPYVRERLAGEKLRATDIRYQFHARLDDEGTGFEPQRNVAGPTFGFEFTGTIAVHGEDEVALLWQGQTQKGPEDVRAFYRAHSSDGGATFGEASAAVSGLGACVCCFLDAHVGDEGRTLLAFRGALEGSRRDTYLAQARTPGADFRARLLDPWKLQTCPASLYGFTETEAGPWVTWETRGQVYLGRVEAGEVEDKIAATGQGRVRKRPCLASNARGQVLLAWSEANTSIRWQVYDPEGRPLLAQPGEATPENRRWPAPMAYADAEGNFVILY